jgi:ABC-type transport system involved in multi-copper enzyme maturation permease subunit
MLKVIIEKEIREMIGSTKFAITFGVCAFLIIIAFYVGGTRHKLYQSQYEASRSETLRAIEGITDWNDMEETHIFLQPQPLESVVSGVSNDIGRTARIYGRGEVKTDGSRYNEDPIFAIFRFIDLEFIFKVILSLFAILLGYDTISGEKERGTLRLSFAYAVPRKTYILGKLIGTFLILTTSILLAIAIGTLLMPLMGIKLAGEEWLKLSLVVLTGLLYFGAFLTLSVFVSALTQRTANSFLILLVVWVMCIHVVPRVSVLLAARSVDVPSVDEIAFKKAGLSHQLGEEFHDGIKRFASGDAGSNAEAFMENFNSYMDSLMDVREQKMMAFADRLYEDRQNRQGVQEKLAFSLARISPATSLSLATSNLAGTSVKLKNHFSKEARDYQTSFANFMVEKTGMNTGATVKIRKSKSCGGGDDEEEDGTKPVDHRELPEFTYDQIDLSQSISAAVVDLGFLSLFNLIFFAGAFVAFIKYDVR